MPIYFDGENGCIGVAWDSKTHEIEVSNPGHGTSVKFTPEKAIELAVETIALAKRCIEYRDRRETE